MVALDADRGELTQVAAIAAAMAEAGEIPSAAAITLAAGDATRMPFADDSFDVVIAAEVLEHIPTDQAAMTEIARVLRPGGIAAVTVPGLAAGANLLAAVRRLPQRAGRARAHLHPAGAGDQAIQGGPCGGDHHHAHALHSPYWWLKCAVGVHDDDHPLASAYHKLLVWDIMRKPAVTRLADRALNPLIGKSLVVYARKSSVPVAGQRPLATEKVHAAA